MDMVKLIRRGLPVGAVQFVLDSRRLTLAELDQIVLPRKTLANRRRIGNLTPEQSDRLIRVARVLAAAEETFGNQEKAGAWLRRPTRALANAHSISSTPTKGPVRSRPCLDVLATGSPPEQIRVHLDLPPELLPDVDSGTANPLLAGQVWPEPNR
jgi:putative toxin-antitoxin system antitoxin component (TIGR02293 family)